MKNLDLLAERMGTIPMQTAEKAVKAKSRDFFWYSPVLKDRLAHVTADAVVSPRSQADVIKTLAACYDLDIPVTARGGGTGNYGQSMPLTGGVVLDMTGFNSILEMRDGVVVAEPGALIGDIDTETRQTLGQELRMHPSTRETATIGGFVSGGSAGVGSIRWGGLSEPGNILRVRMATMEDQPRLIDLTGPDIMKAHHTYGLTGVITEIEMPLAPAPDWVALIIAWDDWDTCLQAGYGIARAEGFWLKQLGAVQAPAPFKFFKRHQKFLRQDDHAMCILVAPNSIDPLVEFAQRYGGRVAFRADNATADDKKGLPHLHHLMWNHTTLRALRTDPVFTYLQLSLPDDDIGACGIIADRFRDEIINHVEFLRSNGGVRMACLPMVRFSTEARLFALIQDLEAIGCQIWNPHAYTWEEGNRRDADADLIAVKQMYDPKGLLNPGKLIGWSDPDYRYNPTGGHVFDGMQKETP